MGGEVVIHSVNSAVENVDVEIVTDTENVTMLVMRNIFMVVTLTKVNMDLV